MKSFVLIRRQDHCPRRLVWCLPMLVLVEQTADEALRLLENAGLLWCHLLAWPGSRTPRTILTTT